MKNTDTEDRKFITWYKAVLAVLLSCVCILFHRCYDLYRNTDRITEYNVIYEREIGLYLQGYLKADNGIKPQDCLGITELDLSATNWIRSLEGLQYFKDLEELEIVASHVNDIRALGELPKLKTLNLRRNRVRDLTPLAGHPSLEVIDLCYNPVTDLSPLASCPNLKKVIIDDFRERDYSVLPEGVMVVHPML